MANILRKNLYLCFSKIKCLPTILSPPLTNDDEELEEDGTHLLPIANSSSFLIKSFNSIYNSSNLIPSSDSNSKSLTSSTDQDLLSSSDDDYSDDNADCVPDFSTILSSHRFFCSSPGNSNSIIDSPERPLLLPESSPAAAVVVSGGVAIQTYSPNPFADFRRSMQEMVEAHGLRDVKADWEFLHELLLCYLNLNPKHTHKFIIGAFTDLIVSLMSSTATSQSSRKTVAGHHQCPSSQPVAM